MLMIPFQNYSTHLLAGGGVPGTCSVQDLSKTGQRFLLGYNKVNGAPHIFSANDALHLSGRNVNEVIINSVIIHSFIYFH